MENKLLLQRLSAVLPDYRQRLEKAQNRHFDALRWQVRAGTLLDSAENKSLICQFLRDHISEAQALIAEIESTPDAPEPGVRTSFAEIKRLAHTFNPGWGLWHLGLPGGIRPWLNERGYYYEDKKKSWFYYRDRDTITKT